MIPAEGFAVAADPSGINVGQSSQVFDPGQLVVQGSFAKLPGNRRLEGMPTAEAAPVIEPPDDKASLRVKHIPLDMIEQVGGLPYRLDTICRVGPAYQ